MSFKLGKLLKKILPIGLGLAAGAIGGPLIGGLVSGGTGLLEGGGGSGGAGGGGTGPTNDYTGTYPSGPDPSGSQTDPYESGYQSGHSAGDPGSAIVTAGDPSLPTSVTGGGSPVNLGALSSLASGLGMSAGQLLGILGPAAGAFLGYNATGKATEQTLAGITKAGDQATSLMGQNQALWAPYANAGAGGIAGLQKYASGAGTLGSGRTLGNGVTLGSMARGR